MHTLELRQLAHATELALVLLKNALIIVATVIQFHIVALGTL